MEGAILQVRVPTAVPGGGAWAPAGETVATANATSTIATRCLNITGFLNYSPVAYPRCRNAKCITPNAPTSLRKKRASVKRTIIQFEMSDRSAELNANRDATTSFRLLRNFGEHLADRRIVVCGSSRAVWNSARRTRDHLPKFEHLGTSGVC
jgi:hypothetical protein